MLGKKAQTGETITWIVATVAIVIILYFTIIIAGGSDFTKNILNLDKSVSYKNSREGVKSIHGFLLYENGRVYYTLRDEENLVSNGDLAKKIFEGIYSRKYDKTWFGVGECDSKCKEGGINGKDNDFFGSQPDDVTYGAYDILGEISSVSNSVYLSNNQYAELFLVGKKNE